MWNTLTVMVKALSKRCQRVASTGFLALEKGTDIAVREVQRLQKATAKSQISDYFAFTNVQYHVQ